MFPQMEGVWYQLEPWKMRFDDFLGIILGFIVYKEGQLLNPKRI